ncbi:hypothetical protein Ahy_B05g076995 isoform B [Arachis hypogaea]|uniref:CCHC-type domain-containing protein n=1 Tax=Arachis hypogaea TaxID=3818 RepID=A0A444Z486_ARAHY|nr:hypothetical protein Ahy_B05g076995 isoform B [Arachis hypogaea]
MNSVVLLEIRNFAELVNKSKLVEECSKKVAIARASHREDSQRDFVQNLAPQGRNFKAIGQFQCWNGNHRDVSLLTRNNGSDNNRDIEQGHESQPHQAQSGVVCPTCGKPHGSRLCRFRTGLCYYCNKEGHRARECRKRMVDESAGKTIKFGFIARGKVRQGNGKRAHQAYINPACKQCGKKHSNRSCQFGSPNCYACGELGHVAKDCPKGFTQNSVRTQQQGRVFAITIDDVVQSNALIQGQVMSRIDF